MRHAPAGGGGLQTARDGMNLSVGDRVVTGNSATALVTFLDGSTLTVQPGSDVVIKAAGATGDAPSRTRIQINVGTVWARVARLVDPRSSFSLESNTAVATVHDGLIGADQDRDGTFVCWTRAGDLAVTDPTGRPLVTLRPDETTTVRPGAPAVAAPFAVTASTVRITTSAGVLPLVMMPDRRRVAGFTPPDLEVNQVYGSFTGVAADGAHTVEVPAGGVGPFDVLVTGLADGPFTVLVVGLNRGQERYRLVLDGRIAQGERMCTEVRQKLAPQLFQDRDLDPTAVAIETALAAPFSKRCGKLASLRIPAPPGR